jgi:hypothetical protein
LTVGRNRVCGNGVVDGERKEEVHFIRYDNLGIVMTQIMT